MSRDKKILLGCIAAVVLFGMCACCGVSFMGFGAVGSAVRPTMEGVQLGQAARDHEACVEAAFTRSDRCADMDMSCAFEVGAFQGGCLGAVPADPTAFCQNTFSAPGATENEAIRLFCTAHGRAPGFGCGVVYGATSDFCEPYQGALP